MSATRTDVHRPKELVTESYEYVAAFDTNAPMWAGSDWAKEIIHKVHQTNSERGMNQCHHCGAHLRYVAVMEHTPTGDYIAIGETCLENRFERATKDFQALRKAAELDRAKQRIKNAIAAFVEANSDLAFMADKDYEHTNSFVADVSRKLRQYGELSERQVAAVRKSIVRDAEYAARKAAEVPEVLVPVVEGKQVITGEVLTVKWQESFYGGSLKMLVKDDRGFKVWGTVPKSLDFHAYDEAQSSVAAKGDKVSFTATVTKSDDDESFGFFSRPTKGTIIQKGEQE